MERGVSLAMSKLSFLILLLSLASSALAIEADGLRELVLAASSQSNIPKLSLQETRKLYLGVPVEKNGKTIKPLLNVSESLLFEVFLQKVTFMSSDAYEKQVLAIVFRLGGQRPQAFHDRQTLNAALLEHPDSVTFMWAKDLDQYRGLKPINTLWAGSAD